MKAKSIIVDYTQGSIPKSLLRFSVPLMLSNALQVLYSLVDMLVVGQVLGSVGLSAVSISSQVFTFMTMVCISFSTAGQIAISQLIGRQQREKLSAVIGTLSSVILIIGLIMALLGIVFGQDILLILSTPADSFSMSLDYILVCSCGIVFCCGYNLVSSVLRGMGDSRRPFIFVSVASLLNIALDIVFVVYLDMAVFGAALATVIGQAVSFLLSIAYLIRQKRALLFDFQLSSFKIDIKVLKMLFSVGIPFVLQSCAIHISMLFATKLINGIGVAAMATFGVGIKIDDIVNKITLGITYAASSMVGQNSASGNPKRVKTIVRWAWLYSAAIYAIFAVIYISFYRDFFLVFTSDADVIALSETFAHALVWSFPAMALKRGADSLIQGVGNARLSCALAMLDGFVFRVLFCYALGDVFSLGLFGYYLGYGLGAYGVAIPGIAYFLSGRWKEYSVTKNL